MTGPNPAGFAVETTKLLDEARLWEEQALQMQTISKKMEELRFAESGLHVFYVPAYHQLVDALVARCNEGSERMTEIRDTLGQIARLYENTEERHARQLGPATP